MDGGLEAKPAVQARSQKFAMGGLFWESGGGAPAAGGQWGRSPKQPEAQGSVLKSKILHFFAKITSFWSYFNKK